MPTPNTPPTEASNLEKGTKLLLDASKLLGGVNFAIPIIAGLIHSIVDEVQLRGIDPGPYKVVRDEAMAIAERSIERDDRYRERHPDA